MSWCRFDDAADGDKMALAVAEVGDAAVAMWFRAILHCSRNLTDGFVDARILPRLTAHKHPMRVAEALVNARLRPDGAGLFVPVEGGYMVHDYLTYNRSRAQAEAERESARKRMAAARSGKRQQAPARPAREGVQESQAAPQLAGDGSAVREVEAHLRAQPALAAALDGDGGAEGMARQVVLAAFEAGKTALVQKAIAEAADAVVARRLANPGEIRTLVLRYVRGVRPELAPVNGRRGRAVQQPGPLEFEIGTAPSPGTDPNPRF